MTAGDELFRNDPVLARASALRSDPIPTSAAEPTAATFGDVIIAAVGRDVLAAAAGRRALHALNERGIDTTGFDVDAYTRGLDPFSAGAAVREAAEQMALNSGQKIIDYGWANGIARNQVRISGGFQAVGGTLMMAAGAAIAAVPGGQVVGLAVAALGADQVAAGVSKVVTNGQVESNPAQWTRGCGRQGICGQRRGSHHNRDSGRRRVRRAESNGTVGGGLGQCRGRVAARRPNAEDWMAMRPGRRQATVRRGNARPSCSRRLKERMTSRLMPTFSRLNGSNTPKQSGLRAFLPMLPAPARPRAPLRTGRTAGS
jgi:hypothetical protein